MLARNCLNAAEVKSASSRSACAATVRATLSPAFRSFATNTIDPPWTGAPEHVDEVRTVTVEECRHRPDAEIEHVLVIDLVELVLLHRIQGIRILDHEVRITGQQAARATRTFGSRL